jgi:ABC-type Fe3+ transport system permease subunit
MEWLVGWLRRQGDVYDAPSTKERGLPAGIVGCFERILAFVLVLFDVPSAGTLLAAWIGAKLAANWQRYPSNETNEFGREYRVQTFVALIAGVVSVGLGCLVGLVLRRLIYGY